MSERPAIDPGLVAALTAGVPARLVKKLDANPQLAAAWVWVCESDITRVTTETGETVTLTVRNGAVTDAAGVRCSCLLSPRCAHVLAVVTLLPLSSGGEAPVPTEAVPPVAALARVAVSSANRDLAAHALRVANDVMRAGCASTGAVLQAELLRVAHAARADGMHRLGAAAVRVVGGVRSLRGDEAGFTLEAYTDDLRDLLATAHRLFHAEAEGVAPEWIGVARRPYDAVGHLRLTGLCSEPVVSSRGYAGIVTLLCDADGRVWTVSDVMPGVPARALDAYDAPAAIGDATLKHRDLVREGLFVQNATGSADGRLGSGAAVRAVRAQAPANWREGGAAIRFAEPLDRQLDRAFASLAIPLERRPRGDTLVFVRAQVLGVDRDALVCCVRGTRRLLRVVTSSDHASLPFGDNLRVLGRAPGLALMLVADIVTDSPRTLAALAIAPDDPIDGDTEGPRMRLPDEWRGRVNLGYETLQSAHLTGLQSVPFEIADTTPGSPEAAMLEPLSRWRDRVAMHGTAGLPPGARLRLDDDRRRLASRAMPWADRLLGALADSCGTNSPTNALASAWLGVATHLEAASRALARSAWND